MATKTACGYTQQSTKATAKARAVLTVMTIAQLLGSMFSTGAGGRGASAMVDDREVGVEWEWDIICCVRRGACGPK
jgi:hypothetical protein